MTRRRLVAGIVVLALGATGCSTTVAGRASSGSGSSAAGIALTDCTAAFEELTEGAPGSDRALSWGCGALAVPLDYDDPDGTQLAIHVVRGRLAGQHDRIGALFVNPGGPGMSGNDLALNLSLTLPLAVLERFDLVGFDPRGVNMSSPVECVPDEYKDLLYGAEPYARTDAEYAEQAEIADTVAQLCYDRYGDDLALINTTNTARDLDRLRESLGQAELTYLGYSYGTTLGSAYAELFPDRVRALVLDAATNPALAEPAATEAQARGFEGAFDAFAAECLANPPCAAGSDPKATVLDILETARQSPLPIDGQNDRTLTVGLVVFGVLAALYNRGQWPTLATAVGAAAGGDGTGLAMLADQYTGRAPDGSYPNVLEANLAVNCADTPERFSDAQIRTVIERMRTQYPLFGAPLGTGLLSCARWDAAPQPIPERDGAGAAPIMVIGTINDPATPYTGAEAMATALDSAFLLTWDGEGHTAYPKTPCITAAVNAYLVDLLVPGQDSCPAG